MLAEDQDWTRQRLQEKLQEQAPRLARLFPQGSHRLVHRRKRRLALRTQVGEVVVKTDYGQDTPTGQWLCPQQEICGLQPHQKMTPQLANKLVFTVTATGSYEEAAALSAKRG